MTLDAQYLNNNGCFTYYVYKFQGNEELCQSNAIVRVYSGNNIMETYSVPNTHGNRWNVFRITQNGIENINMIS